MRGTLNSVVCSPCCFDPSPKRRRRQLSPVTNKGSQRIHFTSILVNNKHKQRDIQQCYADRVNYQIVLRDSIVTLYVRHPQLGTTGGRISSPPSGASSARGMQLRSFPLVFDFLRDSFYEINAFVYLFITYPMFII